MGHHVGAKSALLRRFFYAHACPRAKSVIRLPLPAFQNRAFLRRPRLESPVLPCEMPSKPVHPLQTSKPVHPLQKEKGPPERRGLIRTSSRFKGKAGIAAAIPAFSYPLCTFYGSQRTNHTNVGVMDLHGLPCVLGPLDVLLMHHDLLNE